MILVKLANLFHKLRGPCHHHPKQRGIKANGVAGPWHGFVTSGSQPRGAIWGRAVAILANKQLQAVHVELGMVQLAFVDCSKQHSSGWMV